MGGILLKPAYCTHVHDIDQSTGGDTILQYCPVDLLQSLAVAT